MRYGPANDFRGSKWVLIASETSVDGCQLLVMDFVGFLRTPYQVQICNKAPPAEHR